MGGLDLAKLTDARAGTSIVGAAPSAGAPAQEGWQKAREKKMRIAGWRTHRPQKWLSCLGVVLVELTLWDGRCLGQSGEVSKASPSLTAVSEPYQIEVGDVLEISFFKTPQLNQTRTVGPDGEIQLALIGSLKVAGLTVDKVNALVGEKYGEQLVDPQVTVSIQTFSGMRVYVGGEVNQSGMQPYRGGLSLVQAIMGAGGYRTSAKLGSVVLIRKGQKGEPLGRLIDVKAILSKGRFSDDVALAPSDIIFVPRSKVASVNLFIEQYIRANIPVPIVLGYSITGQD